MRALKNRAGWRVGMLTVLYRGDSRGKSTYWVCRCDCGTIKEVAASTLKPGNTASCGCHRRKVSAELARNLSLTHGKSRTLLYRVWQSLRDRCNNSQAQAYAGYGARGITVCREWEDFTVFESWATLSGYKHGLTIDRVDNDKGYSPDNCRWTTMAQQNNNRRSSVYLTHNGETKTIADWSRGTGLNRHTIHSRLRAGLPIDRVLDSALYGNYRNDKFLGFQKTRPKRRTANNPIGDHKQEVCA